MELGRVHTAIIRDHPERAKLLTEEYQGRLVELGNGSGIDGQAYEDTDLVLARIRAEMATLNSAD